MTPYSQRRSADFAQDLYHPRPCRLTLTKTKGVVNLLSVDMINAQEGAQWPEASRVCGEGKARDGLPGAASLPQLSPVLGSGAEVRSRAAVLRARPIRRADALGLP
jgi:hypothetical protein